MKERLGMNNQQRNKKSRHEKFKCNPIGSQALHNLRRHGRNAYAFQFLTDAQKNVIQHFWNVGMKL
jgi:hypothetical protein